MAYPRYGGGLGNFSNQMQMGQPMPGTGPAVLPGGYPAYPAYPDSYSSAGDPMWTYFTAVADQDGEVDAEELQKCLTQSGISGTFSPFSLETCRIMIAMLDRDYTGKMGFNEFKELWAALNAWKQNFITVDKDGSGTVERHELNQAIAAMGYRLSPQTLTAIVKRYSKNGRIFFDDYVACCVKLRALTGMDHLWVQYHVAFFLNGVPHFLQQVDGIMYFPPLFTIKSNQSFKALKI
ncbi:grancalcin isoform X1 [Neophocaena asiaeorientalis asiaeorientalis]|uniref:Grancalcin isoform X1 n=1 Tax=Neophocaena asiaeorientalis asiaeorientalis TaxID=1706337 RepID=A0A341ARC3_NEOAA|nr:grancalcin isoform X1 [Neophocaena asiaeorientalis asiaeorientalis]